MRPRECLQTDRQIHWQIHRLTDANRFYNLSHAICYSYGTDYNVLKMLKNGCARFIWPMHSVFILSHWPGMPSTCINTRKNASDVLNHRQKQHQSSSISRDQTRDTSECIERRDVPENSHNSCRCHTRTHVRRVGLLGRGKEWPQALRDDRPTAARFFFIFTRFRADAIWEFGLLSMSLKDARGQRNFPTYTPIMSQNLYAPPGGILPRSRHYTQVKILLKLHSTLKSMTRTTVLERSLVDDRTRDVITAVGITTAQLTQWHTRTVRWVSE